MADIVQKLQSELLQLSPKEKAAVAHFLIEDLDGSDDVDTEEIWRNEAESRLRRYRAGELGSSPGKEVFSRARERLNK